MEERSHPKRWEVVRRAWLALLVVGCSRSTPAPAPAVDAAAPAPPVVASAKPDAGGPPSPAQRAAALKDLDEGRKLSRAKDWTKALEAFDRALVVMPDEPRILSEVGWAALQANRLDRAEEANARALASAKEPLVRAPILYNAGRVAEARGRRDVARKAYRESLALRSNAEVKRRLDALSADASPDEVPEALGCRQSFADVAALCRCFQEEAKDEMFVPAHTTFTCGRKSTNPLGDGRFGVVEAGGEDGGERQHLLIVSEAGRIRWLVNLGSDFEPGAFGVHDSASVAGGESRNVAGHTVVVVHSVQDDVDFNMAGLEVCEYHAKRDTICAVGDKPGETKCTPPIAVEARSGCGPNPDLGPEIDESARQALVEIKRTATSRNVKAEWTIAADGRVAVTIAAGSADLLGVAAMNPAPLWK